MADFEQVKIVEDTPPPPPPLKPHILLYNNGLAI